MDRASKRVFNGLDLESLCDIKTKVMQQEVLARRQEWQRKLEKMRLMSKKARRMRVGGPTGDQQRREARFWQAWNDEIDEGGKNGLRMHRVIIK